MYLVRHHPYHNDLELMGSGEIVKGVSANKNLEVTDQCLFLFGNGDGGGGPTPLMMEKVSPTFPLFPSLILPQVNVRHPPFCKSILYSGLELTDSWRDSAR
jgi:alpha-mannosidase